MMKTPIYLLFFISFFPPISTSGQEIYSTIEVDLSSRALSTPLPFDQPIHLKVKYPGIVEVEEVLFVKIEKSKVSQYYNEVYLEESFLNVLDQFESSFSPTIETPPARSEVFSYQYSAESQSEIIDAFSDNDEIKKNKKGKYIGNYEILAKQKPIRFKVLNGDKGSSYLVINLPPLAPNSFYDIKIIRRPVGGELEHYFKLFQYYYSKNHPSFEAQIKVINKIQAPFEHIDWETGALDSASLKQFYIDHKFESIFAAYDTTKVEEEKVALKEKIFLAITTSDLQQDDGHHLPNFYVGESLGSSTTSFKFETRAKQIITPDFGYIYYGFQRDFNGFTPYLGFQLELRYFNKNIPFHLIPNKKFWHRISFHTGITLASLKKTNRREDFFDKQSLLLGASFRLSSAIRLSSGAVMFNRKNTNPLVDTNHLGVTPYFGVSIDLALRPLLNDLSSLIPLNRN